VEEMTMLRFVLGVKREEKASNEHILGTVKRGRSVKRRRDQNCVDMDK